MSEFDPLQSNSACPVRSERANFIFFLSYKIWGQTFRVAPVAHLGADSKACTNVQHTIGAVTFIQQPHSL